MSDLPLELGQTVRSQDGRQGVIRFIGNAAFAKGAWVGLELFDDTGKNDGSVNGERYFDCEPDFGIFVRPGSITEITEQPLKTTNVKAVSKPTNGIATKPRPSSGNLADTARKRQSLVGAGLNPGARMSLRSPTKSPTKPFASSTSSATSTPRTATPTTTARTSDSSVKSRLSTSSRPSKGLPASKPSLSRPSRQSLSSGANKNTTIVGVGSKLSGRQSLSFRQEGTWIEGKKPMDTQASPTIDEGEETEIKTRLNGFLHDTSKVEMSSSEQETLSPVTTEVAESERTLSTVQAVSRSAAPRRFDMEAAAHRETEQLKAMIRTLEKKRQEDRDKIKSIDGLKAENQKYENIIQALQKKLQSSQQDVLGLREKCKDAEALASQIDRKDGEHESEIEMATLDKEMAEERVDALQAEIDALKIRHEELELETELLREENEELGSIMSPEDKASTGWLQMEREKERLKQALLLLRDMSQQTEADLKSQVKDLQRDLTELDEISTKYRDVNEKLSRSEETNKHLMEQLEAAESNEEVNLNLELEKDKYLEQIEEFKNQLQVLQDEVQVNDELERYHIETQKELQEELDMRQTLLNEREYTCVQQDKVIEDLEYTLSKFRDVVSGLQDDVNQMRISRNISEAEASEMSNKSRAIMDLNLKLQNSASKTRLKTIDMELEQMKAEESAQHLSITQMFVAESFSQERNPILALMCFKRIKAKAVIICAVLRDRLKDYHGTLREDHFASFAVLQSLSWISACCDRFVQFMSSCAVSEFAKYQNAVYELEPVERAVNAWIEVLRRDEFCSADGADDLSRMIAVLADLAEKLISPSLESKTNELIAKSAVTEDLLDIISAELLLFSNVVKSHVAEQAEDGDYQHFTTKLDQLVPKTRTMRFVAGRASKELHIHRADSLGLTEPSWAVFARAEASAGELACFVRAVGESILLQANAPERNERFACSEILELITKSANSFLQQTSPTEPSVDDGVLCLASTVQQLHSNVDEMQHVATNLSNTAEFERLPAPWFVRSKELKSQKIIHPDTEEQLRKLKNQVQEQISTLTSKDRQLEEHGIKIELLESRTKDSRHYIATVQKLEAELESLRRAKDKAEIDLEEMRRQHTALVGQNQKEKAELETLKKANIAGDQAPLLGAAFIQDETAMLQLSAEINLLHQELLSLQSAVRYLKTENHRLKTPSPVSGYTLTTSPWLDPLASDRSRRSTKTSFAAAESKDVLDRLLHIAANVKPVALKRGEAKSRTSWRAARSTSKYQVLEQREELENWAEWKDDLLKRVRISQRIKAEKQAPKRDGLQILVPERKADEMLGDPGTPGKSSDGVTIVGSPP